MHVKILLDEHTLTTNMVNFKNYRVYVLAAVSYLGSLLFG